MENRYLRLEGAGILKYKKARVQKIWDNLKAAVSELSRIQSPDDLESWRQTYVGVNGVHKELLKIELVSNLPELYELAIADFRKLQLATERN